MIDVKKKFPDTEEKGRWLSNLPDYEDIVKCFGEPIIYIEEDTYQGDTWAIVKRVSKCARIYGYIQFGWGSCSGCDALQACSTIEELQDLVNELENSINWMSKKEFVKWATHHDFPGDYAWRDKYFKKFVSQVKSLAEKLVEKH